MSMEHIQDNKAPGEALSPPRHWIGPEELDASYWADPTVREKRAQEFHDKPIETIALIDKIDTQGVARREFLTIMGASMAMAGFACARRPVHKIIPYIVKPEEIIPGEAMYYASTDPTTGDGLLVKTREGRPIKLEGNPQHPINQGSLTARGQAALLDLYEVERLKQPAKSDRKGGLSSISGKEADIAVIQKLKEVAHSGKKIRILTGPVLGETQRALLSDFTKTYAGAQHIEFDPLALDEVMDGQEAAYGAAVLPSYRFDQAELIVSLGADFLGTWPFSLEASRRFMSGRKLDEKKHGSAKMSKLVTFETGMSVTGANSDQRYGVRPGDELRVGAAIAYELIVNRRLTRFANESAVAMALAGYKPEVVAQEIGIEAKTIRDVAIALWDARGRSIVAAGGVTSRTAEASGLQAVVNLLNSALENEGQTVDGTVQVVQRRGAGVRGVNTLLQELRAGEVGFLVIAGSNPVYTLSGMGFGAAMAKAGFVVVSSTAPSETTQAADLVLADLHFLENWGDAQPRRGVISLQQPVIAPIHEGTRGFEDALLSWMGKEISWHDYLKTYWKTSVYSEVGSAAPFEFFWESALRDGVIDLFSARGGQPNPSARSFKVGVMNFIPQFAPRGNEVVYLSLYAKNSMRDGAQANNPWLQELPDPVSTVTWDNYVNIGPGLAKNLGVRPNEVLKVTLDDQVVELPAYIQPGMHSYSASIAVGYGRKVAGKVGDGVGVDMFPWVKVMGAQLIFSGFKVKVERTGKLYKLAETQWHNASENRPVINDITLAEFKKNPAQANHTDPHLRMDPVPTMWPKFEYKGYRWGMAIDLSSCTGCGACVIACQAENNIPVVGRKNVRVSREMHWIRIDRYYSGSAENPSVLFQPMMCMHCENAPCETVCPVLATVHDDEGTNNQVYNRCVGTRYCQNNCPYKTRRFNFFDHWKSYEGTMNLAWNPDVTVRTRGIMEKCTFCIQRIRKSKDEAAVRGDKVVDGELKTACQQTCPTEAIVFGDINDPKTKVAKLQAQQRAFRSLEVLNTKPSVSYLTKVRNQAGGSAHGADGHHAAGGSEEGAHG